MDLPSSAVFWDKQAYNLMVSSVRICPGILSPAGNLLVNQLLVVWQHRCFVQLFPPRKVLRQQGKLLPVGLG